MVFAASSFESPWGRYHVFIKIVPNVNALLYSGQENHIHWVIQAHSLSHDSFNLTDSSFKLLHTNIKSKPCASSTSSGGPTTYERQEACSAKTCDLPFRKKNKSFSCWEPSLPNAGIQHIQIRSGTRKTKNRRIRLRKPLPSSLLKSCNYECN